MKPNLKNRPHHEAREQTSDKSKWKIVIVPIDYEEWFEGFEKELRQDIDSLQIVVDEINDENQRTWSKAQIKMLKEILGEV